MSNPLVMLPLLVPLLTAVLLIFFSRKVVLQRWISAGASLITLILSILLAADVHANGIQIEEIGGWKAPFGIVFVADMYASLLLVTSNLVCFAAVLYSFHTVGRDREVFFYHSGVHFLIAGITGAFLTGDIFNLFVFFEVLLMASYLLIVLGGTKIQLRESIKYIVINVVASALFVITVAYLYAITGTLNMADLSQKLSENGQSGLLTVIAILLLVVFGIKGAIFPFYFWLPGSYEAPPAAVTALFGALLTKVGVYSITRVYTLIFIHDKGVTHEVLAWLAALTILFGVIGSLSYWDVKKIVIYNIVTAIGVILFGVAAATPAALEGSIYYLLHDIVIKGTLFLLAGSIAAVAGTSQIKQMGGLIKSHPALAWMFFIAALSLAGIPPFSGFIGKLKIVQGGFEAGHYGMALVVLLSSLFILQSMMRIFIRAFWGEEKPAPQKGVIKPVLFPAALLLAVSVLYGLGTEFAAPFITQAAEVLNDPTIYIDAVLKE
ncbi:Na+/H+ antiporter subunit D [Metabacillus sp. GX 13764]|uniref:Na+/H+ antiporter subunit D n=1 Tax=Metabacillus kandeliae TaxID=2900151 RepID=UPI001E28E979|nr:Na+/H+ antiporter subunit D [Metabacillus kandeliae]MCD7035736.1 Na+/H+ antiporter subunit D [Metabacillus kandeliae]